MTTYLGPAGSLVALPWVGRGGDASLGIPGGTHRLLSGGAVRDRVGQPKRTYQLQWSKLEADNLAIVEGFALGAYGPGPFVLIEPWRRNLLTPNQSSGSDVLRDVSDFYVEPSGSIASSLLNPVQGVRSVLWSSNTSLPSGRTILTGAQSEATMPTAANAVPVLPSTNYTWQASFKASGAVDLQLIIRWFNAAGTNIATAAGSTFTVPTSHGVRSYSASSPSTAAWARVGFTTVAVLSGITIHLDSLQFEAGLTASAWVPGTGGSLVAIDSITDAYPFIGRHDVTMTLVEV